MPMPMDWVEYIEEMEPNSMVMIHRGTDGGWSFTVYIDEGEGQLPLPDHAGVMVATSHRTLHGSSNISLDDAWDTVKEI